MGDEFDQIPPMNRRAWLRFAGVGAGVAALPLLPDALSAAACSTSRTVVRTPNEALRTLMEGNTRFVSGDATVAKRSIARLRELEDKQTPFASILACSDSRVPLEILFDQGFGDLFVARLAGNIATSAAIGTLEYGTRVLGSKLLMVLGHTACGAVSATMSMGEVPGQIGSLFPYIQPAAERVAQKHAGQGKPQLSEVIAENVRYQVEILRRASPVIAGLIRAGELQVVGAVFHFGTGRVQLLES